MTNQPLTFSEKTTVHHGKLTTFAAITKNTSFSDALSEEFGHPVYMFSQLSGIESDLKRTNSHVSAIFIDTSLGLDLDVLMHIINLSKPVFFRNSEETWQCSIKPFCA